MKSLKKDSGYVIWLRRLVIFAFVAVVLYVGVVFFIDRSLPLSDTDATHFDTLIVLGYPAYPDGTPGRDAGAGARGRARVPGRGGAQDHHDWRCCA